MRSTNVINLEGDDSDDDDNGDNDRGSGGGSDGDNGLGQRGHQHLPAAANPRHFGPLHYTCVGNSEVELGKG